MNTCPNCGTQNVDGVRFCVQCGTTLAPPAESWRNDPSQPLNPQPDNSQFGGAANAGGYTPPYDNSPYAAAPPPQSPSSYAPPLPAMSYGTHGASGFGEMRYATWVERVPGALIDGVIAGALSLIVALPFGLLGGDPGGGGIATLGVGLAYILSFGFQIFNDIYLRGTRGSTIGQGIFGLKTVNAEGNTASMGSLTIRFLTRIALSLFTCGIGGLLDVLWPLWDEKKQTLHDKAAGTFVVKK